MLGLFLPGGSKSLFGSRHLGSIRVSRYAGDCGSRLGQGYPRDGNEAELRPVTA